MKRGLQWLVRFSQKKATNFHFLLYAKSPKSFNATYGYQWLFCNRFGIKSLSIPGEKGNADIVSADKFVNSFKIEKLLIAYSNF